MIDMITTYLIGIKFLIIIIYRYYRERKSYKRYQQHGKKLSKP